MSENRLELWQERSTSSTLHLDLGAASDSDIVWLASAAAGHAGSPGIGCGQIAHGGAVDVHAEPRVVAQTRCWLPAAGMDACLPKVNAAIVQTVMGHLSGTARPHQSTTPSHYDINVFRGPAPTRGINSWQVAAAPCNHQPDRATWQHARLQAAGPESRWERAGRVAEVAHWPMLYPSELDGLIPLHWQPAVRRRRDGHWGSVTPARTGIALRECLAQAPRSAWFGRWGYRPRLPKQPTEQDSGWRMSACLLADTALWSITRGHLFQLVGRERYEQAGYPHWVRVIIPVEPETPRSNDLELHWPAKGQVLEFVWHASSPIIIPARRVYLVTHHVQLIRASTGLGIPATAISIDGDSDSVAWQISATLPRIRDAELLQGELVIASINGHEWHLLIDGFRDNRVFGKQSATISGRSLTAELTASLQLPRSYTETSDRTMVQLAEQALPTDWSLRWQAADWLVPGGVLSYSNKAPSEVILMLAEAAGGFILPALDSRAMTVLPRYPVAPWELTDNAVDCVIPSAIMTTQARQLQRGTNADAIWLTAGAAGGLTARVRRAGTAGTRLLPDMTNPLMTDVVGARALGMTALANAMDRSTDTIELPITEDSGIILPGKVIQTPDGRGYSRSLQVSVAMDNSRRLTVRQAIEIERPIGD